VRTPGLGPYPSLVADLRTADGHRCTRFTATVLARIGADCRTNPARTGHPALAEVRLLGTTVEVTRNPGTPLEQARYLLPGADGCYLLAGRPWQLANPPQPSHRDQDRRRPSSVTQPSPTRAERATRPSRPFRWNVRAEPEARATT
jgi:hypothetical protein